MTYYDTLDEDLKRAKAILAKGKTPKDMWEAMDSEVQRWSAEHGGGTIYGADTYAAYKLLESFVEYIEKQRDTRPNRHGYGCPHDGDDLTELRPTDCPCDADGNVSR